MIVADISLIVVPKFWQEVKDIIHTQAMLALVMYPTKYVYARPHDEARQEAEIDRSMYKRKPLIMLVACLVGYYVV